MKFLTYLDDFCATRMFSSVKLIKYHFLTMAMLKLKVELLPWSHDFSFKCGVLSSKRFWDYFKFPNIIDLSWFWQFST